MSFEPIQAHGDRAETGQATACPHAQVEAGRIARLCGCGQPTPAAEQLTRMAQRRAALEGSLLQAGINRKTAQEQINRACERAGSLASHIVARVASQATHDQLHNLPVGILNHTDDVVSHAVNSGTVGALGAFLEWDIGKTLKFCADLLDDVNAHGEAEQVRAMVV